MRIDRLLVYLRFARTRSAARRMIETRSLRVNRKRITRVSQAIAPGDVLTLPFVKHIRIVEILELPAKRCSPQLARAHYRELDRDASFDLAALESDAMLKDGH